MYTYCLKKNYKYVIYGAAFMGKFMLAGLQKAGYKVDAFLDRRAGEIVEVEGISVFHPRDFVNENKEDTIVIVAITNPFEHPMVAKLLVEMGYKKIIYKMSASNQFKSDYVRNLFEVYEDIIKGQIDESRAVYEFDSGFQNVYFEESGVIQKADEEVVVYVPLELCYINTDHGMTQQEKKENPDIAAALDKPICFAEKWGINLFRGFEGYGNIKEAVREFKEYARRNPWRYYTFPPTKQGMEDLITSRYTLFMQMSQQLNSGMEFFIHTPIEAKWNKRGYFNISDGVHRVCFFIAKGLTKIPARMSREDFECWKNESKLKACVEFLQENECLAAYTPIPHPNFYNYPTHRDKAGILRIQHIFEYFRERNVDVKDKKVLEIGSYFSYFAQFFYRMGAAVTTVEFLETSFELGKRFNELLYCGGIKALLGDIAEVDLPETYDITIMLTVFYPYMGTEKGETMLRKIDRVTGKMFLWESGDEPEDEIKYIMERTSFVRYEKIADTYGTGKVRELGVFYKE